MKSNQACIDTACIGSFAQRILSKTSEKVNAGDSQLRDELLQQLIDCRLMGPSCQLSFNGDPSRLSIRELPHGCWSSVYLLYRAHCQTYQEQPASKSTFFAVSQQWRCCMRFHKKTQHAVCATCARLKMAIKHATESLHR